MSDADVLRPAAPQDLATLLLLPSAVGWCLQVFLTGIATCLGLLHLQKRRAGLACPKALQCSGPLLRLALLVNLMATAFTSWEICDYVTSQDRTSDDLGNYKMSDIAAVFPTILVGLITQTFMAHRCWHVTGRYLWFAVLITGLVIIAFGGGIIFATAQTFAYLGKNDFAPSAIPSQIWLWSSALIDIVITGVLSFGLTTMKAGQPGETLALAEYLTDLSLKTCAVPTSLTTIAAVLYAISFKYPICRTAISAIITPLPSFYILSFVYCLEAPSQWHAKISASQQEQLEEGQAFPQPVHVVMPAQKSEERRQWIPAHLLSRSSGAGQTPGFKLTKTMVTTANATENDVSHRLHCSSPRIGIEEPTVVYEFEEKSDVSKSDV